ncbi:MAG: hypothetical protein NZ696_01675 [Thermomicrobium sp.]|nr:hypothetical protein [Thermomicrobium sp.]MDW7982242.1 hypothetical protein [Thermomicrobium sp.]
MALIDVALFILFLALYTVTFLGGVGRALAAVATWFVVTAAAALCTGPLAGGLRDVFPVLTEWASEFLAFLGVVVLVGLLGVWGSLWSLRAAPVVTRRWQGRSGTFGLLLQGVLALLFALFVTVTLAMVAANGIRALPPDAFGLRLQAELDRARLVPLLNDVQPWVRRIAIDWVPGDPPSILEGTRS